MRITKFILILWLFAFTGLSFATVYYSKNEAMELAFGKGTEIESLSLFPDEQQTAKIEQDAKIKLDSGLFTFYVGRSQNKILAYAAIETSNVRTKPETLMIVLTPDGALRDVHTLAFHEPAEYQPPASWFKKLYNRPLAELELNKGVDGISGATLSTRSAINSIRKVMAIYQVMIKNKDPE
jgi:Na+-translocating ferredoxin:NAD+ oxidoreductase RnfG subunit